MTAKVACPIKAIVNLHIHSPMSCVFSFFVEASRSVSTCTTLIRTILCPFARKKVRSPQSRVKLGEQGIIIRLDGRQFEFVPRHVRIVHQKRKLRSF